MSYPKGSIVAQQDVLYYPPVRYACGSLLHDILEWVAVSTSVLTSLIAVLLMVPTGKITLYGGNHRGNKAVPQQNQRTSSDTSGDEPYETRLQAAVTSAGISASQASDIRTRERNEVDSRPAEGASRSSESSAVCVHSYSSASFHPKPTRFHPVRSRGSVAPLAAASQTAGGSVAPPAAASQTAGGSVAPLAEGSHANTAEQDACCCKPCEFCVQRFNVGYNFFLPPPSWLLIGCYISVAPFMIIAGQNLNLDKGDWKDWIFYTCSISYILLSVMLVTKAVKEWRIFRGKRLREIEISTS